jgi:hypothetical protein
MKCSRAEAIKVGTRVEMEHHMGPRMARKIATDHVNESPCYYVELAKMEKRLKR